MAGNSGGLITLRFEQMQTITSFAIGSFSKHTRFRTWIKSGSAAISGNTWAEKTLEQ